MWEDTLFGLPEDFQNLKCGVHQTAQDCAIDHGLDKVQKT